MTKEFYKTSDLGCCSALLTTGAKLIDLDRSDHKRIEFIFQNCPIVEETVKKYWDKELLVESRTFFENTKMLKTRIYAER